MKLYEKGIKKYSDGSKRIIYHIETLKSCNELKGFFMSLQNEFGNMVDIIVKSFVGKREVWLYKRYNDIYDFLEGFNLTDIKKYNIYEFLCGDMHCKLDFEKEIIDIYHSNDIPEPESNNYEYYKFNSGLIVRYNKDNGNCYCLDKNNRWIFRASLQSMLDDAAYDYEIINEPLIETSAEELDKYNKKKTVMYQLYKEFCCNIEFINL